MNNYLYAALLGYALGSFQTSYIIGKLFKKIDIRDYGSGNAGTTNAFRVMGNKAGISTFIGDFLKAYLGFQLSLYLFGDLKISFFTSFFVVVGHNWPLPLKFKGGKGIASTIGLIFAYDWKLGFICFAVALIVGAITRYVSVASLSLSLVFLMYMHLFYIGFDFYVILTWLLCLMAFYRHRSNIIRLKNGTEPKIKISSNKRKD